MNTLEQKEYLERNLEQINAVVSEIIGIKTNLRVEKHMNYLMQDYFKFVDDTNIRNHCGIMKSAFKEVTIESFDMQWQENGVIIRFDFIYERIYGRYDRMQFCEIEIINDVIKIK